MNRLSLPIALALALVAAGSAAAQPAPAAISAAPSPIDPERLAIAQEVVALGFPPAQRQAMFMRVGDAFMKQIREATYGPNGAPPEPGVEPIFQRLADRLRAQVARSTAEASPELFAAIARAYARMFTRDELIQIRAFVATPAGAKYVQRSTDLLSDPDFAAANTAYMARYLEAIKPIQADFMRELTDYYANHPPGKKL